MLRANGFDAVGGLCTLEEERESSSMVLPVMATAYCTQGLTFTGRRAEYGIVATDPRVIPLHSRVVIHGHTFRAEDTGAYIKGHHIDVFMESCDDATRYGVKRYKIRVIRVGMR